MPAEACLSGQQFTNFILTQLPLYESEILRDVRPTDGLASHVSKGQWNAFDGVTHVQDRFRNVKANTAKAWQPITEASCVGLPCDPVENEIGWGTFRNQYGQERQSWKSKLICFDQVFTATQAVDHFMQIISEILKPATSDVSSSWVRRKSIEMAGNKIVADANMTPITFTWDTTGDEQIFATPSAFPTSKLTPEMLKQQIPYLRDVGYFGKWTNDPFWGGYDNFAELITDDDTAWDLDKLAANTRVSDLWRFQQWDAAHEYYKYGMGGQIGNYMTHVDPNSLRFNKIGNKLQYVPKYINDTATSGGVGVTVGIGSRPNPDWYKAPYQWSFIWHRFAWEMQVVNMQSINPMMPFLVRGLNGEWNFATNDLGTDCQTGQAIANYRKNKGFFYADFRYAARPRYTEFMTAILHLREPVVIYTVGLCGTDPGYPAQTYNSANDGCPGSDYTFIPDAAANGHFKLAANSTTCNDEPLANGAIDSTTIAALVIALNADPALGLVGTWSAASANSILLSNATCSVVLPWLAT